MSDDSPSRNGPTRSWGIWRACIFISAILQVGGNICIAWVSIHSIKFGSRVIESDHWIYSQNNLLTFIQVAAKVPNVVTTSIAAFVVSHFWERSLTTKKANLNELQSLGLFQSVFTLGTVAKNVFQGSYHCGRRRYIFIGLAAALQHLYITAIVSLTNPTLTKVTYPSRSYSFQELPFMDQPGFGKRCQPASDNPALQQACIQNMLAGNTLLDVTNYDGRSLRIDDDEDFWVGVNVTYSAESFIAGRLPLGPLNNRDLTQGALLYGVNVGTLERLLSFRGLKDSIWDSVGSTVFVETQIPLITSQCNKDIRNIPSSTILSIQGKNYYLSSPTPRLDEGEVAGLVTRDGLTLVLIFGDTLTPTNIYCAINLMLSVETIRVDSGSSNEPFLVDVQFRPGDLTTDSKNWIPIKSFSQLWLKGLGWGENPVAFPLAELLGTLPIGSELDPSMYPSSRAFLEYYTLAMLGSGISAAFSPEIDSDPSLSTSSRSYAFVKQEFYLGVTTSVKGFFLAIVFANAIITGYFLNHIRQHGWGSDWTDPAVIYENYDKISKSLGNHVALEEIRSEDRQSPYRSSGSLPMHLGDLGIGPTQLTRRTISNENSTGPQN